MFYLQPEARKVIADALKINPQKNERLIKLLSSPVISFHIHDGNYGYCQYLTESDYDEPPKTIGAAIAIILRNYWWEYDEDQDGVNDLVKEYREQGYFSPDERTIKNIKITNLEGDIYYD